MMKSLPFSILIFLILGANLLAFSQKKIPAVFKEVDFPISRSLEEQQIQAKHYKIYKLSLSEIKAGLKGVSHRENQSQHLVLEIPFPDGSLHSYKVFENSTMHPELAAKFPEIRAYDGYGISHPGEFLKFDVTPQGFHAMAMLPGEGTVFIDPMFKGETEFYMVYYKKDFMTTKTATCQITDLEKSYYEFDDATRVPYASCNLRTYRMALAATAEYTTFQGGTVLLAQAAQVTTMNRVNGIYEKNMGITMTIIANNNLLIYTNANTDPYTNGDANKMIGENQTNVTNVIGSANYDIGHVFGTNSGGLAGLGVVCSNTNKARGVTGSSSPKGDSFDVDYVAHEVGHQFGANHTQNNSCQRNTNTAMEPGSASTIMGYAGICTPNVQNFSDAYFHGVSLREMGVFISGGTHTCPVKSTLTNSAPVITSTNGGVTIPKGTPFALTGIATDADGDVLTYNWEQMNNQTSTQPPVATSTGGPNFRSFTPSVNPTRYFPRLSALAANGPFTWEVLPTVARTMNFRLTVQDNHQVASCNDYMDVTVTTSGTIGPFVVTYPNATGISWAASSTQTVTWDVAGTTDTPVNCQTVDIFLSTNGGQTYPIVLATGVPNNGSSQITVPDLGTNTARVMVMSSAGTFFNISRFNFAITLSTFSLTSNLSSNTSCLPESVSYTVNVNSLGGFTDPVTLSVSGLPTGATHTFNPAVVTPGSSSILTVFSTTQVAPGNYNMVVTGTSNAIVKTYNLGYNTVLLSNAIIKNGAMLSAAQTGATYKWLDCNNANAIIPNETNQSFTPTQNGSYAVMVTISSCNKTSDCVSIDFTGIDELVKNGLKIFPNPVRDVLNVSWENSSIQSMTITDTQGRKLLYLNKPDNNFASFDLSAFARGMYFLQLETNGKKEHFKVIKE
jgi:hypothetical protein